MKMTAADGKLRLTDVADTEQLMRLKNMREFMKKLFAYIFVICLFAAMSVGCNKSCPPPCYVQLERNGVAYEEYAVEGQVWLLFDESVDGWDAMQILKENDAKILEYDEEIGYYLVEVEAGTEGQFVARMKRHWAVDYAYPNAIHEAKSVIPYVIDNFYGDHGDMVAQMFAEASGKKLKKIKKENAGEWEWDKKARGEGLNDGKINKLLRLGMLHANPFHSVVINMSIGSRLGAPGLVRPLWFEQRISDEDREDYINRYVSDVVGLVKIVERYYDLWSTDFVIVKAAGNEGMNRLEVIIDRIRKELSYKERAFFDKHFLIVTAKDDNKEGYYPNEVFDGGYDEMVSMVDISDKTAIDLHWQGTSFASPRMAGYIVRAAEEHKLEVTEVLRYVRKATKKAPGHVISFEILDAEIRGMNLIVNLDEDIVGLTVRNPSENNYFSKDFYWKIKKENLLFVSEQSRHKNYDGNTDITALVHLHQGELHVDAEIVLTYAPKNGDMVLQSYRTTDLTIPAQKDYSHYIELRREDIIFSNLMVDNHSDIRLFVAGYFYYDDSPEQIRRFSTTVEPHSSEYATSWLGGDINNYHVHFAYKQ